MGHRETCYLGTVESFVRITVALGLRVAPEFFARLQTGVFLWTCGFEFLFVVKSAWWAPLCAYQEV